jgi:hypothetical protein
MLVGNIATPAKEVTTSHTVFITKSPAIAAMGTNDHRCHKGNLLKNVGALILDRFAFDRFALMMVVIAL